MFKDKQGQTHKFAFQVTNHLFIYLLRFTYFVSNCPWPICGSVECVLFSFQDLMPSLIVLTISMYKHWFNICILITIYNSNNISISISLLNVTYDFMLPPSHFLVKFFSDILYMYLLYTCISLSHISCSTCASLIYKPC